METSFVHLPVELLDLISEHLHLSDLCNLRFVCQDLNEKVTETSRFQSSCAHKNVELWKSTVDELEAKLREPGVHKYLKHLTLTGVLLVTAGLERIIRDGTKPADSNDPWDLRNPRNAQLRRFKVEETLASPAEILDAKSQLSDFREQIETDEAEREAGLDVSALKQLFQTIATRCKAGGLKSLTLDLVVRRERTTSLSPEVSARHVQFVPRAEQILSCALQAWDLSGISIERLNVFSETKGCAVPTLAFTTLQKNVNFDNLRGLTSLSMSICTPLIQPDGREKIYSTDRDAELLPRSEYISRGAAFRETQKELLNSPDHTTGLVAFLKAKSHLQHLSIRTYTIKTSLLPSQAHDSLRSTIFTSLSTVPLPTLKSLTLIGAYLPTSTLLTLLHNSPLLHSLTLHQVTLNAHPTHTWATIFSHITSPTSFISSLHLNNLFHDMPDSTPKIYAFIIVFTPGLEPGDDVRTGESAEERLRRIGRPGWSFERPGVSGGMGFELKGREDVRRGVGYRERDWGWGVGYRNRDEYPGKGEQEEMVREGGEGDDLFLNQRFLGDWRRPGAEGE